MKDVRIYVNDAWFVFVGATPEFATMLENYCHKNGIEYETRPAW